jgi:hypothetical protein
MRAESDPLAVLAKLDGASGQRDQSAYNEEGYEGTASAGSRTLRAALHFKERPCVASHALPKCHFWEAERLGSRRDV